MFWFDFFILVLMTATVWLGHNIIREKILNIQIDGKDMAPNYILQKDNYSCAPVAIANAAKWAGGKFDDQAILNQLRIVCDTKEHDVMSSGTVLEARGTAPSGTYNGIVSRPEFRLVEQKWNPSIKDIKWHLAKGGAVILCYKRKWSRTTGHACLIDQRAGNKYRIINGRSHTIRWENNVYLRKILSYTTQYGYQPCAYLIERN